MVCLFVPAAVYLLISVFKRTLYFSCFRPVVCHCELQDIKCLIYFLHIDIFLFDYLKIHANRNCNVFFRPDQLRKEAGILFGMKFEDTIFSALKKDLEIICENKDLVSFPPIFHLLKICNYQTTGFDFNELKLQAYKTLQIHYSSHSKSM